jgi:hypothetical protein
MPVSPPPEQTASLSLGSHGVTVNAVEQLLRRLPQARFCNELRLWGDRRMEDTREVLMASTGESSTVPDLPLRVTQPIPP